VLVNSFSSVDFLEDRGDNPLWLTELDAFKGEDVLIFIFGYMDTSKDLL
jgi:hypothetical protein